MGNKKKDSSEFWRNWGVPYAYFFEAFEDLNPSTKLVPEKLYSEITPEKLISDGFKKIGYRTYLKDFNKLLALEYEFKGMDVEFIIYRWYINEDNLKKVIQDLEKIKAYLDKKASILSDEFKELSEEHFLIGSGGNLRELGGNESYVNAAIKVAKALHKKGGDFHEKYSDFISVVFQKPTSNNTHPLSQGFFFDAISTTRQFNLYFQFIGLLKELFDNLKTPKGEPRKLTPKAIRYAIFRYHQYMEIIKRIRRLYQNGDFYLDMEDDAERKREVNELISNNKEFSIINEFPINYTFSNPESFLLYIIELEKNGRISNTNKGSKKQREYNWCRKTSEIALTLASFEIGTTKNNLKQILKQNQKYSREARGNSKKFLDPYPLRLENDVKIPADVRKEYIKYAIITFSNSIKDFYKLRLSKKR